MPKEEIYQRINREKLLNKINHDFIAAAIEVL